MPKAVLPPLAMLDQVFEIFLFEPAPFNGVIIITIRIIAMFEGFGQHNLALRSGEDGGCDDKVGNIMIIMIIIVIIIIITITIITIIIVIID